MAERAVVISGSPSAKSKSRTLLERARERLEGAGFEVTVIDLASLPADALLGRRPEPGLREAQESVLQARIVAASSPVYRASYSGLLKTFFDLLPQDCLAGKVGIPILTGGSPAHWLALDHAFRPLFASLGAVVVASAVYGHDGQFKNGPDPALLKQVDRAVEEAVQLVRAGTESATEA